MKQALRHYPDLVDVEDNVSTCDVIFAVLSLRMRGSLWGREI